MSIWFLLSGGAIGIFIGYAGTLVGQLGARNRAIGELVNIRAEITRLQFRLTDVEHAIAGRIAESRENSRIRGRGAQPS